jgi:hypothetical protein
MNTATNLSPLHSAPAAPSLRGRLLGLFGRIGMDPQDNDELRLRKMLLSTITLLTLVAAALWGLMYLAFQEPLAAAIPLAYSTACALNITLFAITRRYHLFCFIQLGLIILLPWLLMLVLGGFVPSSAVILWALLSPIGALLSFFIQQRDILQAKSDTLLLNVLPRDVAAILRHESRVIGTVPIKGKDEMETWYLVGVCRQAEALCST